MCQCRAAVASPPGTPRQAWTREVRCRPCRACSALHQDVPLPQTSPSQNIFRRPPAFRPVSRSRENFWFSSFHGNNIPYFPILHNRPLHLHERICHRQTHFHERCLIWGQSPPSPFHFHPSSLSKPQHRDLREVLVMCRKNISLLNCARRYPYVVLRNHSSRILERLVYLGIVHGRNRGNTCKNY